MDELTAFIVAAKSATYVGDGASTAPTRKGSHDLSFARGRFRYVDSYFGGTDFLGQEVVWENDMPLWAMNYYGRVLRPDLIDGERAAGVIRHALSAMYAEGRFLGGFETAHAGYTYTDESEGGPSQFTGLEQIHYDGILVYRLDYHGGMIVP